MAFGKALINSNIARSLEDAFGAKDITTPAMRAAIQRWYEMYHEEAIRKDYDPSQRIPYTIVRKLTKTVFGEYEADVEGEGAKAENVRALVEQAGNIKTEAMEQSQIGGRAYIKPVLTDSGFDFLIIRRANYLVFARDASGRDTDIGTVEITRDDKYYYTLTERRTLADGTLTIENKLFRSTTTDAIGTRIPLNSLAKYEGLNDTIEITLDHLGLVPLTMPIANCIDGSPEPVAVYAAAAQAIEKSSRHEARFECEFKKAESKIIASDDLIRRDRQGNKSIDDDLFIGLDDDPDKTGFVIFSPEIRDESFLRRKNDTLRTCENIIGLKRGILSEVEAEERTATEITSSAGDYNLTIQDLQNAWEATLAELVEVCDELGQIYYGWDASELPGVSVDFGDGVLYNRDKAFEEQLAMVAGGQLRPEILLGWYYGKKARTESELSDIRRQFMPASQDVI